MPINFTIKKVFIKKIILKENETHYFLLGEYNIKRSQCYLQIEKLTFNKNNYKELNSKKLKDIIKFVDLNNDDNTEKEKEQEMSDDKKKIIEAKTININSIKEINSLFGFIKFNLGYYAILACDSEIIGKIGRNIIYRVDNLKYFSLFQFDNDVLKSKEVFKEEKKYIELIKNFSYDKQLYFSYSYNLTKTLQRNFVESFKKEMVNDFEKDAFKEESGKTSLDKITNYYFCWNYYHIEEFFDLILEKYKKYESWLNFFIYGYFIQHFCNLKGVNLQISIIARRNRHFAGTRYLKRGISSDGNVANDVETEQILEEVNDWIDRPKISSFIQIRGSIPVYWYQVQNAFYKKPGIKANLSDIRYEATKRHFFSLLERYGAPCIVINLTKKIEEGQKNETLLNDLYHNGIDYINDSIKDFEKIIYYHYDLNRERYKEGFSKQFYKISCPLISKTNLFSFIPNLKNKYRISLQDGVLRTNCIDCLDRTNFFQKMLGMAVLVIQLKLIGINETLPEQIVDGIYAILAKMYINMGDNLAQQYTGTSAIKQTITDNTNLSDKVCDKITEAMIAIKRIVNNYFADRKKQDALNLFLGKYKVNSGHPLIWDMPCDDILHSNVNLKFLSSKWYKEGYEKYKKFNLFGDIEDKKILEKEKGKIIYIKKNKDKGNLNKKNKNNINKISVTSKIIYKSLYQNQESGELKKEQYFNKSINEYILDYNDYIKYKSENVDLEEKQFEEESIFHFVLGEKTIENNYILSETKKQNNKKDIQLEQITKNKQTPKSLGENHRFLGIKNDSMNLSLFSKTSKLLRDIEELKLYSFEIKEEDLKVIDKFVEPMKNLSDDGDLYEVENFDINEEDANKIVNENEEKNFGIFYNYKTEKKKEEENDIVINDSIYYLPKLDTFRIKYFSSKNDEEKKDEEIIKEENEDKKINEIEEEENQERQNIYNEDGNNNNITIKRVKLAPLKIENDYFKDT